MKMPTDPNLPLPRILDLKEVIHRTGFSKSQIYRLMKAGAFPKRFERSKRRVGWLESEIVVWIQKTSERRLYWCLTILPDEPFPERRGAP